MLKGIKAILKFVWLFLLPWSLTAQSEGVDLNTYYAFPVSAGVHYRQMSGLGNRALADFEINQIYGEARIPLSGLPVLQPLVRGGVINYGFTGSIDDLNQDWSHNHVFLGPGIAYSSRISREFELGGEFFLALSQSYFTELVYHGVKETQGQLNFLAGLSGRLALNPSYNISISVSPSLNYLRGLGELQDYDGLTFGVGFSASYRFGEDPDAARSTIKALRFDDISLPPVFAAMQSYYVKNPAGTMVIANKEKYALNDISISFMQPGFMDSPSPVAQDIVLEPGESIEIPILLSYNNEVFSTQGITPLTGEVIAGYTVRGREVEQRKSVTYDLHDRNALTWNDDRKAAAFITPQDSAVRNYSSHIRQIHRDETNPYISANLQFAMQAFHALGELGILYQIDPTAPFTEVQGDTFVVDSISLPRETLKRLTGDCDDLTVLYCTMLESIGIDTALVTVPGHIYCAFDTGVASADYKMIHPDRTMSMVIDGTLWIPVEITMIGKHSFLEAWNRGISEFNKWDSDPSRRGFYKTGEAQGLFRPVVLRETDLGLQYGDDEAVVRAFQENINHFTRSVLEPYRSLAETEGTARTWNSYGIAAAKLEELRTAESAFKKALEERADYLSARLNLGSVYFLREKFQSALDLYHRIEESDENSGLSGRIQFNLFLNLSKVHYAMGNQEEAGDYFSRAMELDPDRASEYVYLDTGGGAARASDAAESTISFFE